MTSAHTAASAAPDFQQELLRVVRAVDALPLAQAVQITPRIAQLAQRIADAHAAMTGLPLRPIGEAANSRSTAVLRAVAFDAERAEAPTDEFANELIAIRSAL